MRAMTLRLPDEVHEALRREAFESRRSMNELVLEALIDRGMTSILTADRLRELLLSASDYVADDHTYTLDGHLMMRFEADGLDLDHLAVGLMAATREGSK